ncbi:leucine-rich repeat domain-containing protein [Halosquirtibacter xylanolyticus]|uniref:leucine-rich repeat domain-containing protein n=1 Tax=Halosquirtibacter xylanolyticus TaxID=3374599 RepID=UPI003747C1E4|nr:leucine-rich repeat domain-containing protein [Prolixibacteraceae bacterium]
MKREVLLVIMMFCSWIGWSANKIVRVTSGEWEYHLVEIDGVEGASLDLYKGTDVELEIPEDIDGHHVISLCHDGNVLAGLFDQNYKSVNNNIEKVSTLNAPYLKEIGPSAFQFCKHARFEVYMNDKIEYFGKKAFSGSSISEIDFPSSLKKLGDMCFESCDKLEYLESDLPEEVTVIPFCCFSGCSRFNARIEWIIHSRIEAIGQSAFSNCSKLIGVLSIPLSCKTIGDYAFSNCSKITGGLDLRHVTDLGGGAFSMCESLNGQLQLPLNITTIGERTFLNCSLLTGDLILKDEVLSVGYKAFKGCRSLGPKLQLSASLKKIEGNSFFGCLGFKGDLSIPEGVDEIKFGAFNSCSGFDGTLTIPSTVKIIGNSGFYRCSGLLSVEIKGSSLESVGDYAFSDCKKIVKGVDLPSSLINIGMAAFSGSRVHKKKMTLPEGVTTIAFDAFSWGDNIDVDERRMLNKVYLPSTLEEVGEDAFNGVSSNLSELYVKSEVPPRVLRMADSKWSKPKNRKIIVFDEEAFQHATLHVPADSYDAYVSDVYWGQFQNIEKVVISTAVSDRDVTASVRSINGTYVIDNTEMKWASLECFNISGIKVYSQSIKTTVVTLPSQKTGIYLVRLYSKRKEIALLKLVY